MLPIIQFAWAEFTLVQIRNTRIGQLVQIAMNRSSQDPFVFDDLATKASRGGHSPRCDGHCLQSGAAILGVGPGSWTGGLSQARSPCVSPTKPPHLVARIAKHQDAQIVVVTNDEGFPAGLFVTSAGRVACRESQMQCR